MSDTPETPPDPPAFDFTAYPADTCFYDRRSGADRRGTAKAKEGGPSKADRARAAGRRRSERRRRVDPTTFEKQYSRDELEFMNAMQQFKLRSGRSFPSYGEVLRIAIGLGYRQVGPAQPLGLTESKNG